ncbi:AbrB/MazE/SpoVT family DNA-binding domain-containing protein [Coraliomargarita parva]|uniref:AbrB/MazE/SpoVT family DNA-binding domain-containing protein n=1 Tax=Coraliomargarita parva TaxID=3014050 RepID=UPI0022B3925B|nr:AbrB/MazE/SpoVT family DNA-binding domain-containing protein [Coraliomargarita parva]
MPIKTKVRKIGNSYGIVLPKEALQALKVEEGAELYLTEAPNNTLNINPERPGFDEIMRVAEEGMQRYRNTMRELAK